MKSVCNKFFERMNIHQNICYIFKDGFDQFEAVEVDEDWYFYNMYRSFNREVNIRTIEDNLL